MQRRTFLQASAAAATALSLSPAVLAGLRNTSYLDTIGLQLWTVRNQLASDLRGTIKAVADAGYHQVELMDVMKSDEIVAVAKDHGLNVTSAFLDWNVIGNPGGAGIPAVDTIIDKARTMGLKHLVFGYIGKGHRETADHFRRHAERANGAGEKCRAAGIQLNYHNHSFEFAELPGGGTGFDLFVRHFDHELTKFELDVFWAQIGGFDPLKMIAELKGRIAQLHLKDLKQDTAVQHDEGRVPADAFKELGSGVIDMAAVIRAGADCGVAQCHVEQDQSDDPLASIGQSMRHLKSL